MNNAANQIIAYCLEKGILKYKVRYNIFMGCIFCEIIKGRMPAVKIFEDEKLLVIMDKKPITKGHVLIMPKRHSEYLTETNDDLLGEMFKMAKKVGIALKGSKLGCKGLNYFLADGAEAGQDIFHVHLHVIPRYRKDGFYLNMPRNYEDETSLDKLKSIASKIKIER
jgi:diadenosine tetraphosphate (Ap4A) HIT family hydrolase